MTTTGKKQLLLSNRSLRRCWSKRYLLEQAEKFRVLKELVAEGMDDVASARFFGEEL